MADLYLDDIAARPLSYRCNDGIVDTGITHTERVALVAVARWAQDAPHYDGCQALRNDVRLDPWGKPYRCTCGRDEALARLEADT